MKKEVLYFIGTNYLIMSVPGKNDDPSTYGLYIYRMGKYKGVSDSRYYEAYSEDNNENLDDTYWPYTDDQNRWKESNSISSFKVGNSLYLTAYTDFNHGGISRIFTPTGSNDSDGNYKDLDDYELTNYNDNSKHWDAKIRSICLTSQCPLVVPADVINNWRTAILNLFGTATLHTNSLENPYYEVIAQGCRYNVHFPHIWFEDHKNNDNPRNPYKDLKICVSIKVEDPKERYARITFALDRSGKFVGKVQIKYEKVGDLIPEWAVVAADATIEVGSEGLKATLDSSEEVATDGAATESLMTEDEAINYGAKGLTYGVNHLNTVINYFRKITDHGASLYLTNLAHHILDRTVIACLVTLKGNDTGLEVNSQHSIISLDRTVVFTKINSQYGGQLVHDDIPYDTFNFKNLYDIDGTYVGFPLRYDTWYMETTPLYTGMGMFCSFKLEGYDDNQRDSYMNGTTVFDQNRNIFAIQGTFSYAYADEDMIPPNSGTITYIYVDDDNQPTPTTFYSDDNGHVVASNNGTRKIAQLIETPSDDGPQTTFNIIEEDDDGNAITTLRDAFNYCMKKAMQETIPSAMTMNADNVWILNSPDATTAVIEAIESSLISISN
ncbi:MAG: hypothetical protein AB8G11_14510 [Saprospiraceae bacterium]